MVNKYVLVEMVKIFKTYDYDWMGYPISENNILTYHHIIEKRNGGETSFVNGALLTNEAHRNLHKLEHFDPKLYEEYAYFFRIINDMRCPLTAEMKGIMNNLKSRLEYSISHKSEMKQKQIRLLNQATI